MHRPKKNTAMKLVLLLGAVRWYNLALIVVSQYLIFWLTFSEVSRSGLVGLMRDAHLHIIVASSFCTVAGAFIINAFYDQGKDLVNMPRAVIMGKLLGETPLLNLYFGLNLLALSLALFASFQVVIFFFVYMLFCWLYSHKLQKMPLIREVSAVVLTMTPLFSVWIHHGTWHWGMFYYMGSLAILLFSREVVKDLMGHKGNLIFGYQTVVVATGVKWAKRGLMLLNFGAMGAYLLLLLVQKVSPVLPNWNPDYYLAIAGITLGLSSAVSIGVWLNRDPKQYKIFDLFLKLAVVVHLLSIVAKAWVVVR